MVKDQGLLRHEDIRRQITILPELEELIPPLQAEEFAQLEENILRDGCREALLIWETPRQNIYPGTPGDKQMYILIDGHNRHRICTRHQLDFKIHILPFGSLAEAREYMIDNQLGRRNLNPEQISYLRGKKYNNQKLEKGKYDRQGHKGQNVPYVIGSTSARLAEEFKVNEKTIKRDAEFAEGLDRLDTALRLKILSGKTKVNKLDVQKIAKMDLPDEPIDSIEKMAALTGKTKPDVPAREISVPLSPKKRKIVDKLESLIREISRGTKPVAALCDEIVKCTEELRKLEMPAKAASKK